MAPDAMTGALFGEKPHDDLLALLNSQGIAGIWKTPEGQFEDNRNCLFV